MDDLILIGIMVLIVGIGSYIVKMLVPFQIRLWENSYGMETSKGLRIAYEHSEDCVALQNIYEKVFSCISCKGINFFYGSEEQIRNSMKDGKIDIAILESCGDIKTIDHVFCQTIYLEEQTLEYQDNCLSISPLTSEKVERTIIWETPGKSDIDLFVQAVIADNQISK